jgi:TolB-like protein/DNA-binding winged helix-turn-helix (wHTH) protein/Flp pilus assembly protein TadD
VYETAIRVMPTLGPRETLRFGDFELDLAAYQLRRQGRSVRLERRPMELLIVLLERRGQLVSRSEIVERLWGKDVVIDYETGVNIAISKVRQALKDSSDNPTFVETVVGKGYRFVAPVEVATSPTRDQNDSSITPEPKRASPTGRRHALPAVAMALAAVALIGAATIWAWRASRTPSHVTIAVLPFLNLTGETDREYLADGLTEEAIASFGQMAPGQIHVIGRQAIQGYKHSTKSAAEIGRDLRAHYLVESSIRGDGAQLRITSKLIRVADQVQVWSETFDREPGDVLALQRELITTIAAQIRPRLSPERTTALARRHTNRSDAYDLYLRGRYHGHQRTPAMVQRAIDYYVQAIAIDPNYALAWAGLADAYTSRPINSDSPVLEIQGPALEAAQQAVRAEPHLAEAQTALGRVKFWLEWDWPAAERMFRRAVDLDPGYAQAHLMLGHVLSQTGRHDEAATALARARELDPRHPMHVGISSLVAFQARDYSAALDYAQQTIALDKEFWIGQLLLANAHERLGQHDLAMAAVTRAAGSSRNSKTLSTKGYLLAKVGRQEEARHQLRILLGASQYVPPVSIAVIYAGLDERDSVFEWLDRAIAAHDVHLVFLTRNPIWDPYRNDPRFRAILDRCGFSSH